jgi:hypothetical protein
MLACLGDSSATTNHVKRISSLSVAIVAARCSTLLSKGTFELVLEGVRRKYRLCVYGYVVMPELVHLPLSERITRA